MTDRIDVLRVLDFGKVDAESEPDLDRRFVRTADFDAFTVADTWLALGAKGTGKSALFELLTKHEEYARGLAPKNLESAIISAGTGFSDLSEIGTGDLHELSRERDYDHDRLWRLYIAVRAARALKDLRCVPRGPLRELLVAIGARRDLRVGPLLKGLWKLAIGSPPSQVSLATQGVSVTLNGGDRTLDTVTLLEDIQATLEAEDKELWILFDKIDEIYPADRAERLKALEGLLTACLGIRRTFPRLKPKVLLRTDLYRELEFTNKSHLSDKLITLAWSGDQLIALLLKRALADDDVWELVAEKCPALLEVQTVEDLSREQREEALHVILPSSAYPGQREASISEWITARVTDAQHTVLPREAILLCKKAQQLQMQSADPLPGDSLISRDAMRDAFTELSKARCQTYLAEFPKLKEHFTRFRGQSAFSFTREEVLEIMTGLKPNGDELLTELFDIGLLEPVRGDVKTAESYEIPRLYRVGLGLVIRGRP